MSSCSPGRALSKATVSASPQSPCDLKTCKFHRCFKSSSHASENVQWSCFLSYMELKRSRSFKAFCLIKFPLTLTCRACCSQIHSKRAFASQTLLPLFPRFFFDSPHVGWLQRDSAFENMRHITAFPRACGSLNLACVHLARARRDAFSPNRRLWSRFPICFFWSRLKVCTMAVISPTVEVLVPWQMAWYTILATPCWLMAAWSLIICTILTGIWYLGLDCMNSL